MKDIRLIRKIRRFAILLLVILIVSSAVFVLNGYMEKKPIELKVDNFKSRGVYVEDIKYHTQEVSLYKINREKEYELRDNRSTFRKITKEEANYFEDIYYIGSALDIIVTNRNPLRKLDVAIVRDVVGYFSREYYIGHATINTTSDGSRMIESVGNEKGANGVREVENSWITTEISSSNDAQMIVGLRAKRITDVNMDDVVDEIRTKIGCKYNMNFLLKKKKSYYCTDLISRSLEKFGINIDYDYFFPTGSDFIISDELYIIFICERVSEGKFNIYYLGED